MSESSPRPRKLSRPVDSTRDHFLGPADAPITLVEYGSYVCPSCHAAHEVIAILRDRFGDSMRYVFRQRPIQHDDAAVPSAELAEYAHSAADKFWDAHDALMKRGPHFAPGELQKIAEELALPAHGPATAEAREIAARRVRDDAESAKESGALVSPTFYINGRRYEGAWDVGALSEAMHGSLGHRLHAASLDFVSWGPSTGLLLLAMTFAAVALFNSPLSAWFSALWHTPFGLELGAHAFRMPLQDWVNHGLLTLFFLVVGLEIKRELTVGRLASLRAAAFPVAAAVGGMIAPALVYLAIAPVGPWTTGWGVPIATDTAFAIAILVALGDRVPVELRVFLTAAVIVDDLVSIVVVALFYSGHMHPGALVAAGVVTLLLYLLNRANVYRALPYFALGLLLWVCLHEAGIHATLAGVVLALFTPTRAPGNLPALMAHAQTVIDEENARGSEHVLRHGPSEPALRTLDAIFDRIDSPANRLLRAVEPWSSYFVLPLFALANAGVTLSTAVLAGRSRLVLAIVLGLIVGKPLGILAGAWVAVRSGIAHKPDAYNWRQLAGTGALAGLGFTMSLFIAAQSFPSAPDFAAAKISVFLASFLAALAGALILWPRPRTAPVEIAELTESTES